MYTDQKICSHHHLTKGLRRGGDKPLPPYMISGRGQEGLYLFTATYVGIINK